MIKKYFKSAFVTSLLLMPVMVCADVTAELDQGKQALAQGRYLQANFLFFKILDGEPNNIEAHYGLADSFTMQKNYQRARIELEKLFQLDSHHEAGLLLSASLYLTDQNWSAALRDAQRVIQQNPNSAAAYMYLSSAYAGLGDEPSAKKATERSLQMSAIQKN